jgi:hypothetical protein
MDYVTFYQNTEREKNYEKIHMRKIYVINYVFHFLYQCMYIFYNSYKTFV